MKDPIVISAWKLLVATAETGTVSGAAVKLGLSLPKASRLWSELEDLTGAGRLHDLDRQNLFVFINKLY